MRKILFSFILNFAFLIMCNGQTIESKIKDILKNNNSFDKYSYNISSYNKAKISENLSFVNSSKVYINRSNGNDTLSEFIIKNQDGKFLYGFVQDTLFIIDHEKDIITAKTKFTTKSEIIYNAMRQYVYPRSLFKKSLLDLAMWNEKSSEISSELRGDTTILNLCNTTCEDLFDGIATFKSTVKLKDGLLVSYWSSHNIKKLSSQIKYEFSDYQRLDNDNFDAIRKDFLLSLNRNIINVVIPPNYAKPFDIKHTFNKEIVMYNINDESKKLKDFDKRYVLIDFWFQGCPPCMKAARFLAKNKEAINSHGIEVIGLNIKEDNVDSMKEYVSKSKSKYDQYYVKSRIHLKFMDGYGAPLLVLYDRQKGMVVDYFGGFGDDSADKIIAAVQALNSQ